MKDKNFLLRGLEKQRERMVASEDGSGGWSGLQRDEEPSKQKKGDPSVREVQEGRKFLPRSPRNNVLDHPATRSSYGHRWAAEVWARGTSNALRPRRLQGL